jgi:hypothetical protein
MTDLFKLILGILASRFKARATLEAENLVLRQQVNVLRRRTPKRPHLDPPRHCVRTHRSLNKDAPVSRQIQRLGSIKSHLVP